MLREFLYEYEPSRFLFKLLSMQVEDELVRRRLEGQLVRKSLASFTVSFLHVASFALLGLCRVSEGK
jgi:hypothetical protein